MSAGMQTSPAEQALQDEGARLEGVQAALAALSRAASKLIARTAEVAEVRRREFACMHYEHANSKMQDVQCASQFLYKS